MQRVRDIELPEKFDCVVAVANGGTIPAELFRQRLDVELFLLKINWRDAEHTPKFAAPHLLHPIDFEVKDKRILLVEDRVKTGTTLRMAKQLLEDAGAALVKTAAVNGKADYSLYDENCFMFPWIL